MTPQNTNSAGIKWLFRMAWRDGKAAKRKLLLFVVSIVLGIAAVVAIQSFGETLKENIGLQSKSLMGADYKIDSNAPPNDRVVGIMDSLGGAAAREISFPSMASFSSTEETKFVQVRGVSEAFPLYGVIETTPANAGERYIAEKGALVDATVLLQLDVAPGDSIKIGAITVPIIGALESIPGSSAIFSSVAPSVVLPYSLIEETGLVQTGSRIGYDFYFRASPKMDLEKLDEELDPVLDAEDADLDTHTSTSERLGRRYDNFGKFLNLVAFIALLLGCVGIASAIHIYIREKLRSVAVLQCLGATRKQTFLIYLIQIAGIGLLGGLIGTIAGLVLQQVFPLLLEGILPVDVVWTISPRVILMGILLGVFMSVLFALYPLMQTLYVSPLQALRFDAVANSRSLRAGIFVLGAIFAFILLFSYWLLDNWEYSLSFVAGLVITFSILAGVASLFMHGIKRYFPTKWSFIARQSLLNLYRPQNQTLILLLAIGVGTFLISTLYFTKDILLAQASVETQSESPNMIFLDVQNDQRQGVSDTIENRNLPVLGDIPIVTMRVHSIGNRSVNAIRKDTTSGVRHWVLNHEFRVTYRDSLMVSETIEEGEWVKETSGESVIPISISDNFAKDAQVEVGDTLAFNVQGSIMETRVTSIRLVDWSRMQMNFSIVFPKGVLEEAPQFRVLSTYVPDAKGSAGLQRTLVRNFPNISIIDIRQMLSVIKGLLDKISILINFMAFFSILTGIIVLLGAVRTSKYQRLRESVLLRTLGATGYQILRITALEYFYLGALGSLAGITLSLISSQLLAWLAFDTSFVPSGIPFLILFPGITLLVIAIGLANSREVISSPPLEVLRKEGN